MNDKQQLLLKKVIIVAMLTALCCAATFIQVKMPTGDMVHLGNFVMIMAALLLGGIEGGIIGSFGMGLYDLIFYTSKPSTIIRTFLLKFLIGFIVGYVFRLILRKKSNTTHLLIGATSFFLVLFGVSLGLFIIGDKTNFAFSTGLLSKVDNFFGSGKAVNVSLYIPIFSAIFAIGMGIAIIFQRKLSHRSKAALFAITLAVLVNILGEFILRWLLEGIMVSDFNTSIIIATSKIPGSLITGFISVFLAALIYEPVYRGVKNLDVFKDNTSSYDEEETTELDDVNSKSTVSHNIN
ncbi:MAG: ECF transporter S component [Acholeplasmatales bacterium]|nr:ECF transporter S component [Acholeplasmatales bacterium]